MSLKKFLLDCFFPKNCYGCKKADTWLCQKCLALLKAYQGEIPRALENPKDLIIAGQYHDELLRDLISAYKFDFNQELTLPLFTFLKIALDKKILIDCLTQKNWQNVLVAPIPLHKTRLNWRGFNQSELLAREISSFYGWPLSLDLIKTKKNAIQADLSEEKRRSNQNDVFLWSGQSLNGHDILLVDDIITSGATINEAEKILLKAGARRVIKVALAKG